MNAAAFPIERDPVRHRWAVAILVLVALAMFVPGIASLPPMDRDEPRFAQASKQMLESGDFVSIRFQGEARNKKPVGIYWLQAGAVALGEALGVDDARRQIWLYRLPSLLGAVLTVLGTYWTALAFTPPRSAFLAGLFVASTVLLTAEAHLAKTDAVLAATAVFAMGGLARVYLATRPFRATFPGLLGQDRGLRLAVPAIFWTAVAVGLLVKGPITPMIPLLAAVSLAIKERSISWLRGLRPWLGFSWTLLLVLPWFVLILMRTRGAFLADSLGHDMLGKVAGVQEAHGAPPGTYLAVFWVSAWPMAPFVALAVPLAWRRRAEPGIAFLLAWIVPAWLLFEAVPTKLPNYVLPLYPALAILAATMLAKAEVRPRPTSQGIAVALLVGVMAIGIGIGLWFARGLLWDALPGAVAGLGIATMTAIVGLAVWAGLLTTSRRPERAVLASTGCALLTYWFLFGHVLMPSVSNRMDLSEQLAGLAIRTLKSECRDTTAASAGYREPSLVFLAGTDLLLTSGAGAADFLKQGDCRAAFVTAAERPSFEAAIANAADVHLAGRVAGTAINGAKSLDIAVYVRQTQR